MEQLGEIFMVFVILVGLAIIFAAVLNVYLEVGRKPKPPKPPTFVEHNAMFLGVKRELERKSIKRIMEDKYNIVFFDRTKCDIHRGYHYGFGHPGCPQDLHHHHDEKCPVGCRG